MQTERASAAVCTKCGGLLEETSTGDLGCMVCLLGLGLDELEGDANLRRGPAAGAIEFGAYVISRRDDDSLWELGRGAMGVTYRAIDTTLDRAVALKIINVDFGGSGSDARERFLREARAAAALRHPNVATVYHFGIREETGQCFYAMELVEGETLEARVRRTGPLNALTTIEIGRQVAEALTAAEKRGLVHRDLKPANLMIREHEEGEENSLEVKVIDFGVAKALVEKPDEQTLTRGGFIGTPAFASPEQFTDAPVDARSDIYSLGATLWYLLTARKPFAAQSKLASLAVEPLKVAGVPAALIELVVSMLAPEPAARPANARVLAAQIEACRARTLARGISGRRLALAAAIIIAAASAALFLFHPFESFRRTADVAGGKSIAVLPFENLSDDKQNAYFADGVQDEILTDLAKVADLKVISRISVMEYRNAPKRNAREIGQALRVAYVLEGSVQRDGGRVRVTAQLIDARTDAHLWAEHYDREIADLFAIQTEVAEKISAKLEAKLSPAEKASIDEPPTKDLAAYDAYLRAKELINAEKANWEPSLREAERLLSEAVRADPKFLLAHCELALVHDQIFSYGIDRSHERLDLAGAELQIASAINPDSGEMHLARARHYQVAFHDNDKAKDELTLAAQTLPNNVEVLHVLALIQRHQGNWNDAVRNLEKAASLAPRDFDVLEALASTYRPMHRYRELRRTFAREREIPSAEFTARWNEAWVSLEENADPRPAHLLLGEASKRTGGELELLEADALFLALFERDRPAADAALALMPKEGVTSILGPCPYAFYQGLAAICNGDFAGMQAAYAIARPQVEAAVRANPDYGQALALLAMIDAGLERKDDAMAEGKRAVELLPVSRDAVAGANALFYLAAIYSQLKENDLAIEQLQAAATYPCAFMSYGWLKLLPIFDPLRGDPRFEDIVSSAVRKTAL